ncbi:hypothetical protein BC830DRAFT_1078360 [Chytriomyces sp. MP71]|nr:hypothetical protein BC830DRAFT_1078360 [Chytriomyces sp. MP71]
MHYSSYRGRPATTCGFAWSLLLDLISKWCTVIIAVVASFFVRLPQTTDKFLMMTANAAEFHPSPPTEPSALDLATGLQFEIAAMRDNAVFLMSECVTESQLSLASILFSASNDAHVSLQLSLSSLAMRSDAEHGPDPNANAGDRKLGRAIQILASGSTEAIRNCLEANQGAFAFAASDASVFQVRKAEMVLRAFAANLATFISRIAQLVERNLESIQEVTTPSREIHAQQSHKEEATVAPGVQEALLSEGNPANASTSPTAVFSLPKPSATVRIMDPATKKLVALPASTLVGSSGPYSPTSPSM